MPRQKITLEQVAYLVLNELHWLVVLTVSFCTCFGLTMIIGPLHSALVTNIGDLGARVIVETMIFGASFVLGGLLAPRWRVFSIVPQYLMLGYFGWEYYRDYSNPTYWEYVAKETPTKIPAVIVSIVAIWAFDRWHKAYIRQQRIDDEHLANSIPNISYGVAYEPNPDN